MRLQNDCSEESFPPSPHISATVVRTWRLFPFTMSLRSQSSLLAFLVSVQFFRLMIKETKNTGQCEHHILAEELKDKRRIWNYFDFLLFLFTASLPGTSQFEPPKFYSKTYCITCTNRSYENWAKHLKAFHSLHARRGFFFPTVILWLSSGEGTHIMKQNCPELLGN